MSKQFAIQTTPEMLAHSNREVRWLWEGYLARGMVTLFTSRWKLGKTTLLAFLLSRLGKGGELAGTAVAPGRVVVVSEEPAVLWAARHRKHDFGEAFEWCCRPFQYRPSQQQWDSLVMELAERRADLVVFDPLSMVLPRGSENHADNLLDDLGALRVLTESGAAVLMQHHPKKNCRAGELSPRGSGALTGFADILVELDRPGKAARGERRRWLRSESRLSESTEKLLELSADGRDYIVLPTEEEPESFARGWAVLKGMFEDSHDRLSRKAILNCWPEDHDKPSVRTLIRWLEKAEAAALVERRGTGRMHAPFQYSLPGFIPLMGDVPPLEPLRGFYRQ